MKYTYKESYFYIKKFDVSQDHFHLRDELAIRPNTLERGITVYEKESGEYHCSLISKTGDGRCGTFPFFIDEDDELSLNYDIIEVDIKDLSGLTELEPDSYLRAAKWIESNKGDIIKEVVLTDYIPRLLHLTIPLHALALKSNHFNYEEDISCSEIHEEYPHETSDEYEENFVLSDDDIISMISSNIEFIKENTDDSLLQILSLTQKLIK